jgi:voltage-gated potassium channel
MKIFFHKSVHFLRIISNILTSASFITLSFMGSIVVFSFASIIYYIEADINPDINTFLDALWWSYATTTTIGYGDIVPITDTGKIIGIFLMLMGVAIFSIYTALFARAILDDDVYMQ